MVVAEEMQESVDERRPPSFPDDLRADDDVAELSRHALGQILTSVDREGKDVGRLLDPQVLELQRAHFRRGGEGDPEIAVGNALRVEDVAGERLRTRRV